MKLADKIDCSGCGACEAACANHSVSMIEDDEGFDYPHVNTETCTNCGACARACPSLPLAVVAKKAPMQVFAAWSKDEDIRSKSSSGGVFSEIAILVLRGGGAVVGAAFDQEYIVRHLIVTNENDLHKLRGSKYTQSILDSNVLHEIKRRLNSGGKVLFSGTPCQVSGLKRFLKKEYENLICIDIVCHGVPSRMLWRKYVEKINSKVRRIDRLNFRDKKFGWNKMTFSIQTEGSEKKKYFPALELPFYHAFLRNYSLRPSCYVCKYATVDRVGDITLADFWKVQKYFPECDVAHRGTSLLLVNSSLPLDIFERIEKFPAVLEAAFEGNPNLRAPSSRPIERDTFLHDFRIKSERQIRRQYKLFPNKSFIMVRILKKMLPSKLKGIVKKCMGK